MRGRGPVGILAAGFFFSGQYSKELWLLLGLGPALLAMSGVGPPARRRRQATRTQP